MWKREKGMTALFEPPSRRAPRPTRFRHHEASFAKGATGRIWGHAPFCVIPWPPLSGLDTRNPVAQHHGTLGLSPLLAQLQGDASYCRPLAPSPFRPVAPSCHCDAFWRRPPAEAISAVHESPSRRFAVSALSPTRSLPTHAHTILPPRLSPLVSSSPHAPSP